MTSVDSPWSVRSCRPAALTVPTLSLFFVFNNAVFAVSLSGCIFIISAVVNREKVILRQDPFIPGDISLFNEAFGIVKNFPPKQLFMYSFPCTSITPLELDL